MLRSRSSALQSRSISSRTEIAREAVASHYDELDHFYRDVWGEHVHHGLWLRGDETREQAVLQLVDLVAAQAQITAGTRACDIGCGYGAAARVLAGRGAEVTGITISPAQFAIATQRRRRREPELRPGRLADERTAEPNHSTQRIAIESSEHMPDKAMFFAQASRVLRPGGRLVICAWLAADARERRRLNAGCWSRSVAKDVCRISVASATTKALAQNAGFTLERFEDLTRRVERTWPAIVRRLLVKFATQPRYLRFLFSRHARNRVFALTIPRIWLAYRLNAMRYGIFTFVKGP